MWCEAGFAPDSFWCQTPRTARAALDGYRERVRDSRHAALSLAWHTAALTRTSDFPSLSDLLEDRSQPQSEEDMLFNLQTLAAASAQVEASN